MRIFEKILLRYWRFIKKIDDKRLSLQSEPEDIHVISDIPYIEDAGIANLLDVYYPKDTSKTLPVIIVVHGGGWLYGNKELNKIYAMNLSLRGFAVVNINYHLVHEKRFPEQIKDIYAVLNWIDNNDKKYYLDKNNVFITGDSAGAHLSSIAMALQHNEVMSRELGIKTNINIRAGGLICGVYDLEDFGGIKALIVRKYAKVILGESIKKSPNNRYMSFKSVYNGKVAPLYVMSSRHDFLGSQTLGFGRFLKNNEIDHKYRYWEEDKSRQLTHVFNVLYPLSNESIITNDEMCDFFKENMKN